MNKKPDASVFLRGSLILTVSALTAKICGALFKIPLTALLGGTGMGYFSTAYGLFLPLYAVLVTGISTAVARLVADCVGRGDRAGALAVRQTARRLFLATGLIGTGGACLGAAAFTRISAGSMEAYPAVLVITPAVLLCSITAVERGYWEGLCRMTPTAVSQAVEALARLVCGLWLCRAFLASPPAFLAGCTPQASGACGAVLGVTLSSLAGWAVMLVWNRPETAPAAGTRPVRPILRELIGILIPAALGALVTNLTSLIDLVTVMRTLPDGDPAFVYGSFMGLAVTVFGLVPSLTNMLAKGVLPCTAQAWAAGDRIAAAAYARQVLLLTGLVCIPAGCGIFALPGECLRFLFAGREAEIAASAQSLRLLMPGLICLCLTFPVFSLMQAVGRADLPVKLMLPGVAVKLAGNLLLIPHIGIGGAAVATSACYAVILVPSLILLRRKLGEPLRITGMLGAQGFAGVLCASAAWTVSGRLAMLPQRVSLLCAVCTGGIVYALAMYLLCGRRLMELVRH